MRRWEPGLHSTRAGDGAELEYELVGAAGAPVVCLHGSFTGRRAFSRQRDALLGAGYRLILPSARGHDGSAAALPAGHGFATSEVTDMVAVLDAAGVDRARILGHSTGGAVGFALARAHPERVEALALIEPTLVALLPEPCRAETLAAMQPAVVAAQREGGRPAMRATMDFIGGATWHRLSPQEQADQLDALAPFAGLAAPHIDALMRFPVTEADVVQLRARTLFLYGGASLPFEARIAAQIQELRPDLPLSFIDGAGHNVHRDRPEQVNQALLAFFATAG